MFHLFLYLSYFLIIGFLFRNWFFIGTINSSFKVMYNNLLSTVLFKNVLLVNKPINKITIINNPNRSSPYYEKQIFSIDLHLSEDPIIRELNKPYCLRFGNLELTHISICGKGNVDCSNNNLTKIHLKKGEYFNCSFNKLTVLNKINYTEFNCSNNNLTNIILSKRVKILDCSNNPIKRLHLNHPLDCLIISSNIENLDELIPLCKEIYLID